MDIAAERSDSMLVRAGRMFVLVTSGALAAMVQLAIIPSLTNMSKYFADQGDGTFLSQMVLIIPAPAMVLGAPFAGWLAGRIGKRPLLLGSALLYAIAGGAGLVLPDLWSLLASRVLVGLAAAGLSTAALSLLGDYYEHDRRDRLIGWNAVIGGAGSFVGLPIAGLLAANLGWRGPFFIYLIGLVIFAVALVALGKSRATAAAVAAESGSSGSVRGALIFCLLAAAISIVMYMVSLNGAYLLDAHGITSPSTQSLVIDLTTGASMVGAYMFGVLRKWISYVAAMALTWAVLGVGTLGFGISSELVMFCIFAIFTGFGAGLMQPLTQSGALNAVPPSAASRAIGLALGSIFLGQFLNLGVVTQMRRFMDMQGAFIWLGAAALIAMTVTLLWQLRNAVRPVASAR